METMINVAEILKDKPEGTKLWTDMFGGVTLYIVTDVCDAFQVKHHNKEPWFDKEGKLCKEGVLCIYPSKSMRDWSKFAWKKGDILVNDDDDSHIIFKGFSNDDYTAFEGKHWISVNKKRHISCLNMQNTQEYHIENNKEAAQTYINIIERRLGGKLNLVTLEIEKQTEFKDWDIVHDVHGYNTYIIKEFNNKHIKIYAGLSKQYGAISHKIGISSIFHLRLATEEEKQQLFSALAKEGKAWSAEKKEIVDLKPKVDELKPFDKVLVRGSEDYAWQVSLFGYKNRNYYCCNGCVWSQCIPYEGNEHLLGTTNNAK